MRLFALVARTQLRGSLGWVFVVAALTWVTAPAYASTYATEARRAATVLRAQHDAASLLLYGQLPSPGNSAQMFVWEVGTFTTILAAVAGVLLAVRLTRGAEAAGTTEIVRAHGAPPRAPLWVAVGWLAVVGAALAVGSLGVLWLRRDALDGFAVAGAATYGGTVAATFVVTGLLAVVLGEIVPTVSATYRAAATMLAVAFGLRAWGDLGGHPWAAALSPLGLRGAVRPFSDDNALPLLAAAGAAAVLVAVAGALETRREPGSGLLRPRAASPRRLRVRTPLGLVARLQLGSVVVWGVGVVVATLLVTTMGSGVVTTASEGGIDGGFLAEQLQGADPASSYLAYVARIVGIAVAVFAVVATQVAARDERHGVLEHVRSTGTSRWAPLWAHTLVAMVAALLLLVAAAVVAAGVAPGVLGGDVTALGAVRAVVGQWPAAVVLVAVTTAIVGVRPRWVALAWLPLGLSVLVTMLGGLLDLPELVIELSAFGHAPATWQVGELRSSGVLLLASVALVAAGRAAVERRDEVSG